MVSDDPARRGNSCLKNTQAIASLGKGGNFSTHSLLARPVDLAPLGEVPLVCTLGVRIRSGVSALFTTSGHQVSLLNETNEQCEVTRPSEKLRVVYRKIWPKKRILRRPNLKRCRFRLLPQSLRLLLSQYQALHVPLFC